MGGGMEAANDLLLACLSQPGGTFAIFVTVVVDISLLLEGPDHAQSKSSSPTNTGTQHIRSASASSVPQLEVAACAPASIGTGGKRNMPPHPAESPAKKQSKWSAEEDALIIDLRGGGMKWEDISKRLPGRSAISCRLHYQNYLERRSEWDEEKKNKLARLYERFKPEIWSKVAEEMAIPWRAAEAMHWQLGEADMARRAGVVPFSLSNGPLDTPPGHRPSPPRGHAHSHSHSGSVMSNSRYSRPAAPQIAPGSGRVGNPNRSIAARRDSTPRSVPPPSPSDGLALASIGGSMGIERGMQMLPSVAEMTTGASPYSTPAYAMSMPSGGHKGYTSPGLILPAIGRMEMTPRQEVKRRASPDMGREVSRRRQ
ncbi:hypothetical protein BJ878DRAFT_534458 [Calycina marina]|uniref:MYB transcription factor n=1 Tax=Calycina marina TaxID=1763456 RepID=A0A9P8CFC8_9HELO|nr:hypothetical protein BJ878DRAFT_534458 [Calycina marina]